MLPRFGRRFLGVFWPPKEAVLITKVLLHQNEQLLDDDEGEAGEAGIPVQLLYICVSC